MTAIDSTSNQPAAGGPAAGWYHDPALQDGTRLRWWDGATWSEHTRPVASPPPPPSPLAQVPLAAATPAYGAARAVPSSVGVAAQRRALHNGTAWWSFGLGVVALSIASLVLVAGHHTSIWISSSGAIAILSGVRALRLRSLGFASALVPAVLGIAFGAVGTLIMLGMLLTA